MYIMRQNGDLFTASLNMSSTDSFFLALLESPKSVQVNGRNVLYVFKELGVDAGHASKVKKVKT
jgi:hypothetical protein